MRIEAVQNERRPYTIGNHPITQRHDMLTSSSHSQHPRAQTDAASLNTVWFFSGMRSSSQAPFFSVNDRIVEWYLSVDIVPRESD